MNDIAGGYKYADQTWSEVGIKIAALTAMKGTAAFTTNMASGSISSISAGMQWDANGNYTGFDNEAYGNAFINSMVGEGAMRGYFSSMIQTGIGSTLNYGFEGEFKGLLNGKLADSQAFKSMVTA